MLFIGQSQIKVPVSFLVETWPLRSLCASSLCTISNVCVHFKNTYVPESVARTQPKDYLDPCLSQKKKGRELPDFITVHLPGLKRNQPSDFAGPPWDHLQGFCSCAQARKWSQHRNILLVSHAADFRNYTVIFTAHTYMATVQQILCTFLLQV